MDEYLAFAKDLARQGGQLIKDNFDSNPDFDLKPDHSPVTQVDKAINDLVAQSIQTTYPQHGLLGEEAGYGTGNEALQWLCDPLDGTKSFILGVPLVTFILGLTRKGQVLLAVVYNPFTGQLYHAVKGQGAFCNDKPIKASDTTLSEGGYVIVSESSFQFAETIEAAGAQIEPMAGAGYRSMLVATGRCCAVLQGQAAVYDVGPASLIIEEAGGKATDLYGQPLRYSAPLADGIILSNGICHDELLALVSSKHKN